jgi:hypothetical protein
VLAEDFLGTLQIATRISGNDRFVLSDRSVTDVRAPVSLCTRSAATRPATSPYASIKPDRFVHAETPDSAFALLRDVLESEVGKWLFVEIGAQSY